MFRLVRDVTGEMHCIFSFLGGVYSQWLNIACAVQYWENSNKTKHSLHKVPNDESLHRQWLDLYG